MSNSYALEQQVKLYQAERLREAEQHRQARRATGNKPHQQAVGRAVVIGGSIGGLLAARVLSDYFAWVTIIERDQLSIEPEFRPGTPQTRHAHVLLRQGQEIMEQHFPGLTDELVARGAITIDHPDEQALYYAGGRKRAGRTVPPFSISCSRPLLDATVYQHITTHPRIRVLQEQEVLGLDAAGHRVTGVRIRNRNGTAKATTIVQADLVIDASGRRSRAPQWLSSLGYAAPRETTINSHSGYATRLYRRPGGGDQNWKSLFVKPSAPDGSRGGAIIPIEGDRWHVMLIGMAGDYPPTSEEEFLAFARTLPATEFYEAIQDAEPLTKPYGFRSFGNRVRHYDKLPRYLEGFLVYGDAVYAPNPVYSQGMTMAALSSLALQETLQAHHHRRAAGEINGLAWVFHRRMSQAIAALWQKAIREDQSWPSTEVVDSHLPALQQPVMA